LLLRALEGQGKIREYRFEFDGAAEGYQRLIDDGKRIGDARMQVSGTNKLSLIRGFFFDEREAALQQLDESEQLARDLDLGEGLVEACISQCYLRTAFAEFDEVEYYMKEVTTLGNEMGAGESTLFGMSHLANTLVYLTRFDEALIEAERALERAEELGNLHYQAELLTFPIPFCHMRNGDMDAAGAAVERGMEIALRIGDRGAESLGGILQGKAAMDRGHVEDALAIFRRAKAAAEATGLPTYRALSLCVTGTCHVQIGGPYVSTALDLHAETLDVMELPTGKSLGAWLWSEMGYCAMAANHLEDAHDLFDRALNEPTAPMYLMRPTSLLGKAELALKEDHIDVARALHAEAAAAVEEASMWDRRSEVSYVAGIIEAAAGDHSGALDHYDECERLLHAGGKRRRLIEVEAARARSLDALHRAEEAAAAREAGRTIAADIEAAINDEGLRSAFRQGAEEMLGLASSR
jgi:tetratricopeptide (TPR) repeat protein